MYKCIISCSSHTHVFVMLHAWDKPDWQMHILICAVHDSRSINDAFTHHLHPFSFLFVRETPVSVCLPDSAPSWLIVWINRASPLFLGRKIKTKNPTCHDEKPSEGTDNNGIIIGRQNARSICPLAGANDLHFPSSQWLRHRPAGIDCQPRNGWVATTTTQTRTHTHKQRQTNEPNKFKARLVTFYRAPINILYLAAGTSLLLLLLL